MTASHSQVYLFASHDTPRDTLFSSSLSSLFKKQSIHVYLLSSSVNPVVTVFSLHPGIRILDYLLQQKTARKIMDDLEVLVGVSDESDDLLQSSSDIEVQANSLEYEGHDEQASVHLKVRPSDFVSSNASNGHQS